MLLLATSSALVLLVATTTATLIDDSRQRDLLQRTVAGRVAPLQAAPCAVQPGTTRIVLTPRASLDVVAGAGGALRRLTLDARWLSASLGTPSRHARTTVAVGWCE